MKVLLVASGNEKSIYGVSSFVYEQAAALSQQGVDADIFPIMGKGLAGYLRAVKQINLKLSSGDYDIVHGHYLTAALTTLFQKNTPIVATFIGCDINVPRFRRISRLTIFNKARAVVFVSEELKNISGYRGTSSVIPYAIDLQKFYPVNKVESRSYLSWDKNKIYLLFASRFDRIEKNSKLVLEALDILKRKGINVVLIEFKDIPADDLNFYYNASDVFVLSSIREGSPQSIKEAMACNCPIVSTDVGDVSWVIEDTEGCYLTSFESEDVANRINSALEFSKTNSRTNGRERIMKLGLDSESIANKIIEIYKKVLN